MGHKKAHGMTNPRKTTGMGSKVGNPGDSMRSRATNGKSVTINRRSQRG